MQFIEYKATIKMKNNKFIQIDGLLMKYNFYDSYLLDLFISNNYVAFRLLAYKNLTPTKQVIINTFNEDR